MKRIYALIFVVISTGSILAQTKNFKQNILLLNRFKSFSQAEQFLVKASLDARQRGETGQSIYYQLVLAETYQRNGYLEEAERHFVSALNESKSNLPLKSNRYYLGTNASQKTYFDAYDNLGFFYLSMGNIRRAEELFQESKKLRDLYFSQHSVHRIMPLVGLGSSAYRKKQYDEAYSFFLDALRQLKKASTTSYDYDQVYRLIYNDLAEICIITGRSKEVDKYIELLSIASSGVLKYGSKIARNLETARVFDIYARNELIKGNYKKAQMYLDRAGDFLPPNQSSSLINFRLQLTQARLYWINNNLSKSADTFKELMKSYLDFIANNFTALSEYEKEKFYYTLKQDLEIFNAFVVTCHEQNLAAGFKLYEVVYDNQLNLKALLLGSINRRKNTIVNSGDLELLELQKKWETARGQLSALYYTKDAESQITEITREVERLDKELNTRTNFRQSSPITWQQVNQFLHDGDYALEIVRVANMNPATGLVVDNRVNYLILVNQPFDQLQCFSLSNGSELETRSIRYYRNSMVAQSDDEISYDMFWEPIRQKLPDAKHLYLSPDGVYSQINLNVLQNPRTGKYLLDETDVIYLTNTSDLLNEKPLNSRKTALLFGRPSYSSTLPTNSVEGFRSLQNAELVSLKDQTFADLPGTEAEIITAEASLKKAGWNVTRYSAEHASEMNLKLIDSPSVLHVATHGFFIGDTSGLVNPMIRSGLLLAGVSNNQSTNQQDGILTAYEAALLNLQNTNLVVLSACETGLGEVRNGEGVYGLQRAMVSAGTKNLLMSLWKVDDMATNELMGGFYKQWTTSTMNIRDAFKFAQSEVRKKYPHPFYWGAFIMLGN